MIAALRPCPLLARMKDQDRFDQAMMRLAILLARPGKTFPNPPVGCVITKNKRVIGLGATSGVGGIIHAEEMALKQAGQNVQDAHVYVTLEPCAKRSQGTGGCAEKLKDQGVGAVFYACHDPSPYANHQGPDLLRRAGIEVHSGLLEDEAAALIAPWAYYLRHGRPLITVLDTELETAGIDTKFNPVTTDLNAELAQHLSLGHRHLWINADHPFVDDLKQMGWI
jgi:pyrimidine deaminase RibD-like protein